MTIEIRDASLEARLRKQLQATGSSSVEEVLLRLLEIGRGIAQLDRGEGIPEDQFRAKGQEALNDPRPAIPHKKVEAHFAKRRAAALRKAR